ncbi:MAG: superoxide dismutase [Cu-Zn] SodC [Legionellaceae bacterium]|nr:superoxide dismutase [Cu-Zn] SodC [Legionellaceae bacterium]
MLRFWPIVLGLCCIVSVTSVFADISVPMYTTSTSGTGSSVGSVDITETKYGLLFTPHLHSLTPGLHGFHVHQNPSCGSSGMDAGGHLDPVNTNKHLGPFNDEGHLGDLPVLYISTDGTATLPVLAPRLRSLTDIQHHSLMIHEGGDNFSDIPEKLGGGGARMECGVVK